MDGRSPGAVFPLDGADWQLLHLVPREWELCQVWREDWETKGTFPAVTSWIRGSVPGDVIADAWDAGLIPDPYVDMNSRACEWLAARDWVYRKDFTGPDLERGEVLRLCFEGVDFSCRVYLNGELLGAHEGMFTPFEFDVTEKVRPGRRNRLVVVVMHAPPVEAVQGQVGRTSEARLWKARFAYGWDWCTRLVPLGIWRGVRLVRTGPVWLEDVWVRPRVDLSAGEERPLAEVDVEVTARSRLLADGVRIGVKVLDGERVAASALQEVELGGPRAKAVVRLQIPEPRLWWPNGMGGQPLYRVEVTLHAAGRVSDTRAMTTGLRTVRLVPNEGAPADALPYTLEVNGRRLFARGWNWVPVDHMYGRDQGNIPPAGHPVADRYRRLAGLAAHAHCNLLRVWGGGLLESEKFYDWCDRLGILVWQEFPLSSSGIDNRPPTDAAYLDYIEAEARRMVPLRRNHPSLALWCGGNELMDDAGGPLTEAHPALARLKAVVSELDPDRGWLPTSPSGPEWHSSREKAGTGRQHDVHGPWKYQDDGDHYRYFDTIDPLLHSEFGVDGAANPETLRRFISGRYLFPPDGSNPAWVHHGSWWLHRERIEKLFGPIDTLEAFVRASQWLQAEGLRYSIEAHRRRTGRCGGTLPWQFNEAFPNTSCTSAVDYLLRPKPAYWWIRLAYAPVSVSLKYDRLTWAPGETWSAELWSVGSGRARRFCRWQVRLLDLSGALLLEEAGSIDLEGDIPARLAELRVRLPEDRKAFIAFVESDSAEGDAPVRNDYVFSTAEPPMRPLLHAPESKLMVRRDGERVIVENGSGAPALFVQVTPPADALPEAGYFSLPPRAVRVIGSGEAGSLWRVRAWNATEASG